MTPLQLAGLFHDTYERLAPSFGYETRPETKLFRPTSPNGRLMIAVCTEILEKLDEQNAWKELAKARDELLVCYRLGKRPTEKLLTRIEHAKKALGP
jgi:hypothetical protein